MASGGPRKTRLARVAALGLAPGNWKRAWNQLCHRGVLVRIGLCLAAAVLLCVVMRAWEPPFAFRTDEIPSRDVAARVSFKLLDPIATDMARDRARWQVRHVYVLDSRPLVQLRAALRNKMLEVLAATGYAQLSPKLWNEFQPSAGAGGGPSAAELKRRYERLREALQGDESLAQFSKALAEALAPWEQQGLLLRTPQKPYEGNQDEIVVYSGGDADARQLVRVSEVLLGDGSSLRERLRRYLGSQDVAGPVYCWLRPRLESTLAPDEVETRKALDTAAASVKDVVRTYAVGQTLAEAFRPLGAREMEVLQQEHAAYLAGRSWMEKLGRAAASLGLVLACFGLCGLYLFYREQALLVNVTRLAVMLALVVITVALARWAAADAWRAEIIPLLLFGQTAAIAYRRELALLFAGVAALLVVLALGQGLAALVLLLGVTATAVLQLGTVRSRIKLVHVAVVAALVAFLLRLAYALLNDRPPDLALLAEAARLALWTLAAGFLMTGLLPFIERLFGVLTDMSLLELGDVSHPLLQELVRRAPSTYNHSINVGAIAEAAADAIGARGLLVRVGAYFHDIGKMLKPGYFAENQGPDNLHESLVPRMSTLVIVAHVKDGADLARQHNVPPPIIDFIQQHHGTTLVEYFYGRASQQSQQDPNSPDVDESAFRYPGPRPQTKETAVLMLADAVESACRTLVEPTAARIESLVREIADRKLDDGQFDESNLTLRELRTIEDSMIKSLISTYHSRVKYPEQKTA